MIRRGKAEGWLSMPPEAFRPWALLNGVAFHEVKTGAIEGRGSALLASKAVTNSAEGAECLLTVPKDLILSQERVMEHAKADRDFREVLESLGDFGRLREVPSPRTPPNFLDTPRTRPAFWHNASPRYNFKVEVSPPRIRPPHIFNCPHSLASPHRKSHSPSNPSFVRQPSPARRGWNNTLDLSICHQPTNPFNNRFALLATPDEPSDFTPATSFTATTSSYTTPTPHQTLPPFPVPSVRTRNSRGTKEAKKRRDVRRNRRKLAAQLLDEQLGATIDATLTRANIPPPPPARPAYLPAPPSPGQELPPSCLETNFGGLGGRCPMTPPEVPELRFDAFDTTVFPNLVATNHERTVHEASPFDALPPWCPPIRSLTLQDVWRETLPTFFDLSSLPEPKELPRKAAASAVSKEGCKDLQLWRPPLTPGRKTSRFFPPKDSRPQVKATEDDVSGEPMAERKVKVKLPPTRVKLHPTDTVPKRSSTALDKLILPRPKNKLNFTRAKHVRARKAEKHSSGAELAVPVFSCEKEVIPSTTSDKEHATIPDPDEAVLDGATAANLWRILASSHTPTPPLAPHFQAQKMEYFTTHLPYLPDTYEPQHTSLLYPFAAQLCASPQELDGREVGREVPYVHANSLTGYSNDSEDTLIGASHSQATLQGLADSGVGLPILHNDDLHLGRDEVLDDEEEMVGLNEMIVDHGILSCSRVLGIARRTPLPVSSDAEIEDLAAVLPVDCITPTSSSSSSSDNDESCTAHFLSERALFHPSPISSPSTPRSAPGALREKLANSEPAAQTSSSSLISSLIDVEAFLELGHARDCWCGAREPVACADTDEGVPFLESEVPLLVDVDIERDQAGSDVATTGSELGGESDGDDEWLVYDSDTVEEDGEVACTPLSPGLHHEAFETVRGFGKCERRGDVCLERRSSEGLLEWEWEWDF